MQIRLTLKCYEKPLILSFFLGGSACFWQIDFGSNNNNSNNKSSKWLSSTTFILISNETQNANDRFIFQCCRFACQSTWPRCWLMSRLLEPAGWARIPHSQAIFPNSSIEPQKHFIYIWTFLFFWQLSIQWVFSWFCFHIRICFDVGATHAK